MARGRTGTRDLANRAGATGTAVAARATRKLSPVT
jgi:hypothetical protein